MDKYQRYCELAKSEKEGTDYKRFVCPRAGALVAVIAPHGGGIEPKTDSIAKEIAADEFSFYCFLGLKKKKNGDLHITSHNFDDPKCLNLIANHRWVVAVHGCNKPGERVFLGGLDKALIDDLASKLGAVGIIVETSGHSYSATLPNNICNRGKSNAGVQFELSRKFRDGSQIPAFVRAVREVLSARQNTELCL